MADLRHPVGTLPVLALVVAACVAIDPSPSPPSSPAASEGVAPTANAPEGMRLTCGDGHSFAPAALLAVGHAHLDPDPAAQALRDYLSTDPAMANGVLSWVRVSQTADRVQFIGRRAQGVDPIVVGFFVHDGAWTLDIAGDCRPEVAIPAGVGRAVWRLDPAFPPPAPADRVIHVLINERACASGRSPEGRVLPPAIVPSPTAMTIAILVRSRPGGQDCPGNPDYAITIELPEPLAGRPLLDGAVFPPRDVTLPQPDG